MSDCFELNNLFEGIEGAVKGAALLSEAKKTVPGFAEYFDGKSRSNEHLGARFESGILDIQLYRPGRGVFCLISYSTSMDDQQTLRATFFGNGTEFASKNNYDGKDVIRGYQGIMLAETYQDGQDSMAEMIIKIRGEKVHFDIPIK
jgi:hypothetical protein